MAAARTTPDDSLSGTWLASRLGIEPHRLDAQRRAGEVLAARRPGEMEWRYPAWQFKRGFELIPGIDRVVAAARAAGVDDERLSELLGQRAGLVQGGTLADQLREGRVDHVVAAVRAAA
jgi:hypothetical protein